MTTVTESETLAPARVVHHRSTADVANAVKFEDVGPNPRLARRALVLLGRAVWKSAAIALLLLLWEFGPNAFLDPSTRVFLPPLHDDLSAWWQLAKSGGLQAHL